MPALHQEFLRALYDLRAVKPHKRLIDLEYKAYRLGVYRDL